MTKAIRRKDTKGRVLKTGESQRKDGRYQYRYTDNLGNRLCIYDTDLNELRRKENEIQANKHAGLILKKSTTTVYELCERYIALRENMRFSTRRGYGTILRRIQKHPISNRLVTDVKKSEAIKFCVDLQKKASLAFSTISNTVGVLKPAFQLAIDDKMLLENPFKIELKKHLQNDTKKVEAIPSEVLDQFLPYVKNHPDMKYYYDDFIILLQTGLRGSEYVGLNKSCIDFDKNLIHVKHQLIRKNNNSTIVKPKTKGSIRSIPITPLAKTSLLALLERNKKFAEVIVDGQNGFLTFSKHGRVQCSNGLSHALANTLKFYNAEHGTDYKFTPHGFRHTFITRLVQAGMNIKDIQYLSGHDDVKVLLNIYASKDPNAAQKAMLNNALSLNVKI